MYVRQQTDRLVGARADAATKLAQFRADTDVVYVAAINDTGGTFHVYMGEDGALQSVASGIQTVAPPIEVLTLGPHQNGPLIVHDWRNKYITSQTTYVWLAATSLPPVRLIDAGYSLGQDSRAIMLYRAIPNASDQNYRMTELNLPPTLDQTGQSIASQEETKIHDAENKARVDEWRYPTSFNSYAAAELARFMGIHMSAGP